MYGEKITGESWLMRDLWPTTDVKVERGGNFGLATHPQKLKNGSIKRLLIRALSAQGIRPHLQDGVRRHEVKGTHGYRKFFKTHAENVMKPINVELLMGHDSGISESYWRPTENEVLHDYLKAVDLLTINYDNNKSTLQKQVSELTEKSREENYIIKGKLAEKEKEIEALARKAEEADTMKKEMAELQKKLKEFDERYETDQRKTKRIIEIKASKVEAAQKERLKDSERIAEIEKKLLLKERKEKEGKQNNKANNKITLSGNSDAMYYRKDRQGRIRIIRI